ncbi:UNVERIFIED_ORG: hypothetical protein M2393_001082 [Pseudomonas psychrophila]
MWLPAKAAAEEQPFLADWDAVVAQGVVGQAADVAAVAQDHPSLPQADRAESGKHHGGPEAQAWVQCQRPGSGQAQHGAAGTDRDGVQLHRRA